MFFRKFLLLFFLLICFDCFSQKTVSILGKVSDKNGPLEGAAVYLNNSMKGTTTTNKGEFTLKVLPGEYDLIITFLGYKTQKFNLVTINYTQPLDFILEEKEDILNEIVIWNSKKKNKEYNSRQKKYLEIFKREFLGESNLAKDCKILNPEQLYFTYDSKTQTLQAKANEPIRINNYGLGYEITFDLLSFKNYKNTTSYKGYTRFKKLEGLKKVKRRWKRNRKKAYKGSPRHFIKSVTENKVEENGFLIKQFRRIKNINRPSEKQIIEAKLFLERNKIKPKFSRYIINNPKNKVDSATVIISKSKEKPYKDIFYRENLTGSQIFTEIDGKLQLTYQNNLKIIYNDEKEERNYILKSADISRRPNYQVSNFIIAKKPIFINKKGQILNPQNIFFEGYWSFEKFAHTLPLDYVFE